MKLIDSHCHLDFEPLSENIAGYIESAARSNVLKMINVGTSVRRSERSVEIADYYPNVWATVGIHPHDSEEITDIEDAMEKIEKLAEHEKVVAIGEIGLDYSQIQNEKEKIQNQKELFIRQIKLAQELELPVVIHIRDAWDDFFKILNSNEYNLPSSGVVHCFTGDAVIAKKITGLGIYLGFTGFITFEQPKFDDIREALIAVPLDRILIETDAPFLAPEPHRGKTNEPAYVFEVARKVAELKGITTEEVAEQTTKNTEKLFGI